MKVLGISFGRRNQRSDVMVKEALFAAKAAGEKSIEMLHLKDLTKVTGYIRGGCTSIGMKKQDPIFIHEAAKEQDKITVSGGRLGLQITLSPDDLCRAAKAEYADIIK